MGDAPGLVLEWIEADDPRMAEVHVLRHVTLMEPFGLARWDVDETALPFSSVVVALRDGVVVGTAALVVQPGEWTGFVRLVCVAEAERGAGVGRAVMAAVEMRARDRGLELIWLDARIRAEGFYHRLGYRTTTGPFPSGRTALPHVRMELSLR